MNVILISIPGNRYLNQLASRCIVINKVLCMGFEMEYLMSAKEQMPSSLAVKFNAFIKIQLFGFDFFFFLFVLQSLICQK